MSDLVIGDEGYYKGYKAGRADERKTIMKIVDSAEDIAQAMSLLGKYIMEEELKCED